MLAISIQKPIRSAVLGNVLRAVGVENVAVDPVPIPSFAAGKLREIACAESLRRHVVPLSFEVAPTAGAREANRNSRVKGAESHPSVNFRNPSTAVRRTWNAGLALGLQDFATRCIRPERMSQMQISHVISAVERHYFRRTLPDMVMSETEDIAAFAPLSRGTGTQVSQLDRDGGQGLKAEIPIHTRSTTLIFSAKIKDFGRLPILLSP